VRVVTDIEELVRDVPTVMTIGAFDGVHLGHQYLIRSVMDRAAAIGGQALVLTFEPIPLVVLRPGSKQLTDGAEKARLMGEVGPDMLAMLTFDLELASVPADEFLEKIERHVNLAEIWVGADFAFGHRRSGTVQFLIDRGQEDSFAVHIVPRQTIDGVRISSTRVREAVEAGNMAAARLLLGHAFEVDGPIVRGEARGAGLGFPTANVATRPTQILPRLGIYAGYLHVDGRRLAAAISVGYNVVFGGQEVKVEAFVLDFEGDLRDRDARVEFTAWLREERNFESVDALIEQMGNDVTEVRRVLAADAGVIADSFHP
jgi:riboflavin kinase/FMN adenylyltransferase